MAGEDRPSLFGGFGNQNYRFRGAPGPVPDTRRFVDYARERAAPQMQPSSVFKGTDYKNIEPTVIALDLSVVRAGVQLVVAGNLIWYQSSTNLSDILRIGYNQSGATPIPFQPGNKLGGVPFSQLYLTNAAIAGATAILIILQDTPEQPISVL